MVDQKIIWVCWTTFLEPLFYTFLEKWLQNKWSIVCVYFELDTILTLSLYIFFQVRKSNFWLNRERNFVKSKCVQKLSSKVRSNNARIREKKYSGGKKQLTCSCQVTIKRDKSILHTITLCYISDWFCDHFPSLCVVTGNGYYLYLYCKYL